MTGQPPPDDGPIELHSIEVLSPDSVNPVEHSQMLDRWKHWAAICVLGFGFLIVCAVILLPFEAFDQVREKAWTLFTVLLSSAAAYLYSANEEK